MRFLIPTAPTAFLCAAAQGGGEFTSLQVPPDAASYQLLMHSNSSSSSDALQQAVEHTTLQQQQQWGSAPAESASFSDSGVLTPVSLVASKPTHKAAEYRVQLFTADRISAGLPAGQRVVLELLGPSDTARQATVHNSSSSSNADAGLGPALLHAELPRARSSFGRGSAEAFTVLPGSGDVGDVAAVLLWHEPDGGGLGGGWCLERIEVEAKLKGIRYSFSNRINNGWVGRGRSRAVLLTKPRISKRGDSEALQAEAVELQRQLEGNAGLSGEDRQLLQRRLGQLQARLAAAS
jgi:hypothetical protein